MEILEIGNTKNNICIAKSYIQIFNAPNCIDKLYEDAVTSVFRQFPKNNCTKEILIKVCILNRLYSTSIYDVNGVANNITKANISNLITTGDESVIQKVASCGPNGMYIYSFATKYCSFHAPQEYIMFDNRVYKTLMYYKKKCAFSKFSATDLHDYSKYKVVIRDFQKAFGLDLHLRDLDKFMWKHGGDLLQDQKKHKKLFNNIEM